MGRTCRECGWMKDVGAASLLETKLCRESMRGERQSPISIVSRNRTLNQMKQSHKQLVAADAARVRGARQTWQKEGRTGGRTGC